ncbi:MAG: efflux RND transporter permease subunit [Synergistetes bacterium]|nr:efflux RND transporter permease subunit [Synergistota bacterium]MCX8127596.1 efflux RND transporter permease subunit [Synergistota bacterium]MDW8191487.1 efflux RND transporter permease subunit [Synergistota bacterium]
MNLPSLAVRKPIATLMVFLASILLGMVSLYFMPIDLLPKFDIPSISVITPWPGASAGDVETEVTKKLEDQLSLVEGIDNIYSKSFDNLSVVTLAFKWGTDLDARMNDVRDQINFIKRDLPDGAEEPIVLKLSSAIAPVAVISVYSEKHYESLRHIAEREIGDKLKQVPGVGRIMVYGGLEREIKIKLDPQKLEAYGISIQRLRSTLSAENINIPAGSLKVGRTEFFIRVPGKFKDADEIANTVLGNISGKIVRLRDIAEVEDSYKDREMFSYSEGKPSVILIALKNIDANTVEVARGVRKKLEEISKTLPSYVKLNLVLDTSRYIFLSLRNLTSSLLYGIAFVIIVTYALLGSAKPSLIIAFAIPFSLIINFLIMKISNFTINVMTLSALAIASGMVVDNAIVVTDSIMEYRIKGARPEIAAVLGTEEVGSAIMASSLTTIVVFVPLMFISGLTSILFRSLGIVTIGAITASLLVALTLTPVATVKLIREETLQKRGLIAKIGDRILSSIENNYKALISWSLRHKKMVVALASLLFIMTIYGFRFVDTEFVPEPDTGDLEVNITLPEGTNVDYTNKVLKNLISYINEKVPEVVHTGGFCGETEQGLGKALGQNEGPNAATLYIRLKDLKERQRRARNIADELRKYLSLLPGIEKVSIKASSGIRSMFMGGKSIIIEIYGSDLNEIAKVARSIEKVVKEIPGTVDVALGKREDRPEIHILIDREKASFLDLNIATIADTLRSYLYGSSPTEFTESGENYDITLKLSNARSYEISKLAELPIQSLSGKFVKLGTIAEIKQDYGTSEILRKDRERYITVECNVSGRALGAVVKDIEKALSNIEIPQGIRIKFGGEVEQQEESFQQLGWLFLIGIVLVYMVMAGQFEAFGHPFVIMFSVPFALTGAVFAFLLTGVPLSIQGFLGIVMLVGIVVNNAIVLVDYTNLLRARGVKLYEAVEEAGRRRLRPVLMTTLTTIFGMLPLALNKGEGAEIWKALAISMIGGMTVSTLVTLVLIPVVYTIYEEHIIPLFLRKKEAILSEASSDSLR